MLEVTLGLMMKKDERELWTVSIKEWESLDKSSSLYRDLHDLVLSREFIGIHSSDGVIEGFLKLNEKNQLDYYRI